MNDMPMASSRLVRASYVLMRAGKEQCPVKDELEFNRTKVI